MEVEGLKEQRRQREVLDPEGDLEPPPVRVENHDFGMVWCGVEIVVATMPERKRIIEAVSGEEWCEVVWTA